jgi:bifunctional non-homologous end joining protein LigD
MQSYKPMLAKNCPKPFSHKDWLFEVKWDGFRALAYVDGRFYLKSRNGNEFKYNFPEITELKSLTENVVLDGELVILKGGLPDLEAMQKRFQSNRQQEIERQVKTNPAAYIIFDILEKDGTPLIRLPLLERKRILKESVKEGQHCILSDYVDGDGEGYFKLVAARGLEGLVAKKKNSFYEEGKRSDCWLKIKNLRTCDCVIFGWRIGDNGFSAMVGLYDKQELIHVANLEYGFTREVKETLVDFFKEITIWKEDANTYLKPVVVCEVIYQSVLSNRTLRFPRFHRIRFDKAPNECTIDQIAGFWKML